MSLNIDAGWMKSSGNSLRPGRDAPPLAPTWRAQKPPKLEDVSSRRMILIRLWLLVLLVIVIALLGGTFASTAYWVTKDATTPSPASPPPPSLSPFAPPPPRAPPSPHQPPPPPPPPQGPIIMLKRTECVHVIGGIRVSFSRNGRCNDGGPGSVSALCALGNDYPDCPVRYVMKKTV